MQWKRVIMVGQLEIHAPLNDIEFLTSTIKKHYSGFCSL